MKSHAAYSLIRFYESPVPTHYPGICTLAAFCRWIAWPSVCPGTHLAPTRHPLPPQVRMMVQLPTHGALAHAGAPAPSKLKAVAATAPTLYPLTLRSRLAWSYTDLQLGFGFCFFSTSFHKVSPIRTVFLLALEVVMTSALSIFTIHIFESSTQHIPGILPISRTACVAGHVSQLSR